MPNGNGNGQRDDDRRITYFAATHTRGKREIFGIRSIDRGKHMYIIGKTGMGKSTMLENMAIQDIQNGEGICFIDPHGSTAEKLLDFVPHDRIQDVIYFAPFDTDFPMGFNVMEDVGYDKRHLVVSGLMGAFRRIWVDAWSARMEYILQNTMLALLEFPSSTLLDVNRMLTNKTFRNAVIEKVTDPVVKAFWTEEFANFTDTYTREATPAIQNKIGQFVSNPLVRNIVGQPKSTVDLRAAMDTKKIFIVNLSKGRMGETNASLLGSMLTVKIYLAAMSRADEPNSRIGLLPRFYFYVDEFQSMMNEAFADILSESRKYKLALTLANQYIEQMDEKVRDAVFGNVGSLVCFRVGPFDAEVLKTVFEPTFHAEDLVGLGLGEIYLTLMIDGVGSRPFSAETIPPIEAPAISYRDDVIQWSRDKYSAPRADIEALVKQRQEEYAPPPREEKRPRRAPQRMGGSMQDEPAREPREVLREQLQQMGAVQHAAPAPAAPAPAPAPRRFAEPEVSQSPEAGMGERPERFAPRPYPPAASAIAHGAPAPRQSPQSKPAPQHAHPAQPPEVQKRAALRAAIAAAKKPAAQEFDAGRSIKRDEPSHSPVSVMRERMAKKAHEEVRSQEGNPNKPYSRAARAEQGSITGEGEDGEAERKKTKTSETDVLKDDDISPEILKRVLYGGGAMDE